MTSFFATLKKHYLSQCYGQKQILKIISSMGLFGSISESLGNLSSAVESLVYHPSHDENVVRGTAIGLMVFAKETVVAVTNPFWSFYESMKDGMATLLQRRRQGDIEIEVDAQDNAMLERDIEQVQRDLQNFATPLNVIDSQNRIWIKIIFKEKSQKEMALPGMEDVLNDEVALEEN
jgi:hypothetical protein